MGDYNLKWCVWVSGGQVGESYTGYYSSPASQDVELLMRQAYRHTCEGNCRLGCPPGMLVMDYVD